jgi:hypothetical protein
MKCIGYYCGASPEKGRASLENKAAKRGLELMLVLCDGENGFGSFRQAQNLIKLHECDTVLVPSYSALGCDKYMRLENELFIERNGARLVTLDGSMRDLRHDTVLAAKRCVSFLPEFDENYGLSMPLPDNPCEFKRIPPIGYRSVSGGIEIDPVSVDAVSAVFDGFVIGETVSEICAEANEALAGSGRRLSNMTVRAMLENRRYLGVQSDKGYHLPPLIRYDTWLEARERLERERGSSDDMELYFKRIVRKKPIRFVNSFTKAGSSSFVEVNTGALISGLERIVKEAASNNAAQRLMNRYAAEELEEAKNALPAAVRERNNLLRLFKRDIELVSDGARSPRLLERIDERTDLKNMLGLRVRRIAAEAELFSASEAPISRFLSRAARIGELSIEERALIMNAFIDKVVIGKSGAFAFVKDTETGKLKKVPVPDALK